MMQSILDVPGTSEPTDTGESREAYRIFAASPSKPDDVVLLDSSGKYRLYIGSTGTVSRGTLNSALVEALLERENWGRVEPGPTLTIDELRGITLKRKSRQTLWRWMRGYLSRRESP